MTAWGVASEIWSWVQSAGTLGALALAAKFYLDRRRLIQSAAVDEAAKEGGDWTRLRAEIDRLDERCDHLQREVDECRRREGEWMTRALQAEALMQGNGEIRQAASIAAAEVRIDAADRKKNGDT
jgi:hypothetical protein